MYILLDACQHPGVLRVLYFGLLILDIVFTVLPIGLIVMLLIDFSKAVISNDEKTVKGTKIVVKRIVNAMIVFCIPWIVSVFMNLLNGAGLGEEYASCITNARSGNLDYYDKLLENEEGSNRGNSGNNNGNSGSNDDASLTVLEKAANRLIEVAGYEVGKNNNSGKYGNSTIGWCQQFTRWALSQVNLPSSNLYSYLKINADADISGDGASDLWPAFQSRKKESIKFHFSKAYGENYTPKKGDIIWYQWENGYCRSTYGEWNKINKCADHVGIVTGSDAENVYTIEGNAGDPGLVRKREINVKSDEIIAYGSWYE